jgi:hypothetical protein
VRQQPNAQLFTTIAALASHARANSIGVACNRSPFRYERSRFCSPPASLIGLTTDDTVFGKVLLLPKTLG